MCLYAVAHFMEHIPKSARDLLDGACAYRMEMIDSLNVSAQKRLGSMACEQSGLKTIMSERQSVYDKVQKAVGSYRDAVSKTSTSLRLSLAPVKEENKMRAVRASAPSSHARISLPRLPIVQVRRHSSTGLLQSSRGPSLAGRRGKREDM